MRTVLKILAVPFWLVLWILAPVMMFLFITAKIVLFFLMLLAIAASVFLFIDKSILGGIVFAVIAFLISPIGIPAIAQWLVEKIYQLKNALGDFIKS